MSVMAPALTTEAVGQAKIPLKGSPPPELIEAPHLVNGGGQGNTLDQVSHIASGNSTLKTINDLNKADLDKSTRGLLKPIQGNGRRHTLYTVENPVKFQKGLKDLGLIQNLPGVLKQIAAREQEVNKRNSVSDHLYYHKAGGRKMNTTSNVAGQNGNGKQIVRQNSLGSTTVNGHPYIPNNKISVPTIKQIGRIDTENMCRTTETTSLPSHTVAPSPVTSKPQVVSGIITPVVHGASSLFVKSQEPIIHRIVEVMKMPENQEQTSENSLQKTEDLMKDATRKEVLLEKRSQFLLRRLRRLQGKQLELQAKTQIKSFTEHQHQNLQIVATKAIRPNSSPMDRDNSLFHSNDVKNLSTSALVNLVRKIQTSQSKLSLEQRLNRNKVETRGVLVMDPSASAETERKSGHLRTNVKHWNENVDSDATESSSGGESCDESGDEELTTQPAPVAL